MRIFAAACLFALVCALLIGSDDAFAYGDPKLRKIKLKCAAEIGALTKNGKSWSVRSRSGLRVFYACVEREGGPRIAL